jgi:hypothetical protein
MEMRGQRIDHWREQHINLPLLAEDQLTIVSAHAFHRIAAIDGATTATVLPSLLLAGFGREYDIPRIDTQRLQQGNPESMRRPNVENTRDADADLRAGS